jgi:hypothetical protein
LDELGYDLIVRILCVDFAVFPPPQMPTLRVTGEDVVLMPWIVVELNSLPSPAIPLQQIMRSLAPQNTAGRPWLLFLS